jgi:Ser/Thr protein kinase RdoA (MazF antagonist)
MKERDLAAIISNFQIKGSYLSGAPIGSGHINDSYLIRNAQSNAPDYMLQWINNYVFKDVEGLMNNFLIVTQHITRKHKDEHTKNALLELVAAKDGKYYYQDEAGNYWRVFNYIAGSHVYDIVENKTIAYEGGKAFGRFLLEMADIPVGSICETIPDFHNAEKRLDNFYSSVKADPKDRVKDITPELEFVRKRVDEILEIPSMQQQGLIPVRITHNDTKFNNILFDDSNKAICIVDLDTIMPGSALFDFGDAIRSGANTAAEDEKDLSLVSMNIDIFEAYAKGYLESTFNILTETEIELLAFSARFITFVIGLRFLTDYIDGDTYYRTHYPEHNLVRARVQFKLVESMEQQFGRMRGIIQSIAKINTR